MENSNSRFISIENQIQLINSVIKSTADLLAVLTGTSLLNKPVTDIISLIFKFLDQILYLLPDLIQTNEKLTKPKDELRDKFELMLQAWSEYFISPVEFYNYWIDFVAAWSKYNVAMYEVTRAKDTIFLSLN